MWYYESMDKSQNSANYEGYKVGYKRPPIEHRFKPGHTGNAKGRPKNTLKEFAREYLKKMTVAERVKFLNSVDPDLVWRMAEGNPDTKTKFGGEVKVIPILGGLTNQDVQTDHSSEEDTPA